MAEANVNPLDGEAELRQSFRDYESRIAYDNARRAAVFAALFMLAASSLDWVILTERALDFLLIRSVCAASHCGSSSQLICRPYSASAPPDAMKSSMSTLFC